MTNIGTFTVDIEDDACSVSSLTNFGPSVTFDSDNGHVQLSIVTNFAITNGHGVYYTNTDDVPLDRAAYYDIPSRTLTLVAEL